MDADGSPRAYHPDGPNAGALDYTANAGKPGNWYGIVTDTGHSDGNPIVQGAADPAPGFYISPTSLHDATKPSRDPARYVDAATVPYFVLAPEARQKFNVALGDLAIVANGKRGLLVPAIFADVGPHGKLGEGSVSLATQLAINPSARHGGTSADVVYLVFPGSASQPAWPRAADDIISAASALFDAWGGAAQLAQVFPAYAAALTAQSSPPDPDSQESKTDCRESIVDGDRLGIENRISDPRARCRRRRCDSCNAIGRREVADETILLGAILLLGAGRASAASGFGPEATTFRCGGSTPTWAPACSATSRAAPGGPAACGTCASA